MLALRFDLLPAAYCDELFKLLNQVEPFSYDDVRAIITEELGADPETVFRSFSHASFAAASIGQVHRAILHSGEPVAVKVQRPGIRDDARGGHRPDVLDDPDPRLDPRLRGHPQSRGHRRVRPLDGRRARLPGRGAPGGRCSTRTRKGDKLERIARVYRDYTTSRVLTTELIDGIPLIEIMVAKREGNTGLPRGAGGSRPRPGPDRPQPRLEHAQPGLCLRLLPRRPPPGQPVRAARRRDRLRRLRDRRPAARTASATR